MNETGAAAKHLYDTLLASEALAALVGTRIYADAGKQGATYPFVLISHMGGSDRRVPGADARMMTRDRWLVACHHNERNPALARKISGLIDAALVGATDTVTLDAQAYHILAVYRDQPVERGGDVNGVYYIQSGGVYVVPVTTR
jgi:hypothetical protein